MKWTFPELNEVDNLFPYNFAHVPCVVFVCSPLAYHAYHPRLANYIGNNVFLGKKSSVAPIQNFPKKLFN
jgi:hypothetical protein